MPTPGRSFRPRNRLAGPPILAQQAFEVVPIDATFTTTVGAAPAAGGSTSFTGGATFTTTVGNAPASGGSSTFTGSAVFATTVGNAPASGGSTSFTGGATFTTTVGNAPAAGGSSTFTGGATFATTVGNAPASGGSTSFTGSATFSTTGGTATASGGSTTFDAVSPDATFESIVGALLASGGIGTFEGTDGSFVPDLFTGGGGTRGPQQTPPKAKKAAAHAVFGADAGPAVMTAHGGVSTFTGTTAYPLTTDGHNNNVLELVLGEL